MHSRIAIAKQILHGVFLALLLSLAACSNNTEKSVPESTVDSPATIAAPLTAEQQAAAAMDALWAQWNDPVSQRIEPFKIFDNLYYVGIEWVAAYLLVTDAGLVLIDSLYGDWTNVLIENVRTLGYDPAHIKYVIVTHGHFDHAGGAAQLQSAFGAKVVMTTKDWTLAAQPAEDPRLAFALPKRDIVATDRDSITLGDTQITLLQTPGHTAGVLSLRYQVYDNGTPFEAITLGGVGRNFNGVQRTEQYIASYERLLRDTSNVQVSLPNHAVMGQVFERRELLRQRGNGAPHPFVDTAAYMQTLQTALTAGRNKLTKERDGTALSTLEELSNTLTPKDR